MCDACFSGQNVCRRLTETNACVHRGTLFGREELEQAQHQRVRFPTSMTPISRPNPSPPPVVRPNNLLVVRTPTSSLECNETKQVELLKLWLPNFDSYANSVLTNVLPPPSRSSGPPGAPPASPQVESRTQGIGQVFRHSHVQRILQHHAESSTREDPAISFNRPVFETPPTPAKRKILASTFRPTFVYNAL